MAVTVDQTPTINIVGTEPMAYAELRIETRELEHTYSKLEVPHHAAIYNSIVHVL